jgi:hypothetical protein
MIFILFILFIEKRNFFSKEKYFFNISDDLTEVTFLEDIKKRISYRLNYVEKILISEIYNNWCDSCNTCLLSTKKKPSNGDGL